jgi:lipopolysaccharide O-acetyltransferase
MSIKIFSGIIKSFRFIYMTFFHRGFGTSQWKRRFVRFGENSEIAYPPLAIDSCSISIGDNSTILKYARLQSFPSKICKKPQINIGSGCYICHFFTVLNASEVNIGNNVLIASYVMISSENHGMNPEAEVPYLKQPLESIPVVIKDGCWIGEKVCILPGVTIGEKCIIGAGSVVTKSIPDYCIAVGNPAKVIKKYNFNTHQWDSVL